MPRHRVLKYGKYQALYFPKPEGEVVDELFDNNTSTDAEFAIYIYLSSCYCKCRVCACLLILWTFTVRRFEIRYKLSVYLS